jgi:hypothetical protein
MEGTRSTQNVFEGCAEVGFFVAVLHDHWRVYAEAPLGGFALCDGAGAGNDDCGGGNDEWLVSGGAQDCSVDEVEDRSAAGEDGSSGENCAFADDGALVNASVAANEDVVFNDDGTGVDGLEDATDLCCSTEMDTFADLRAGANEGVGIDKCAFIDVSADVDVHGRDADDATGNKGSGADG